MPFEGGAKVGWQRSGISPVPLSFSFPIYPHRFLSQKKILPPLCTYIKKPFRSRPPPPPPFLHSFSSEIPIKKIGGMLETRSSPVNKHHSPPSPPPPPPFFRPGGTVRFPFCYFSRCDAMRCCLFFSFGFFRTRYTGEGGALLPHFPHFYSFSSSKQESSKTLTLFLFSTGRGGRG